MRTLCFHCRGPGSIPGWHPQPQGTAGKKNTGRKGMWFLIKTRSAKNSDKRNNTKKNTINKIKFKKLKKKETHTKRVVWD